ncbi:MAG: peptidoglycan-associated lipoprotein Pal [Magnetovibrionaceae bacterium]
MLVRVLSVFAAVFFLAACASDQGSGSSASGTGGGTTATSSSGGTAATGGTGGTTGGPTPGSNADLVASVGDRVFFDYDSYSLTSAARQTLEGQAAWMKRYPAVRIAVEGHADERGTREYNLALGDRRANAVKDYLVALGIAPGRITTISYGKERPVAFGSNESAWAQNRRGVTAVSGAGS